METVHVLIVDGDDHVAETVRRELKNEVSVSTARSGEEAFYLAATAEFDLVVMNVKLPIRDGVTILKSIRRLGLALPVLLFCAQATPEERQAGLESGADAYLAGRLVVSDLLAYIRSTLKRARRDSGLEFRLADLEVDVRRRAVFRAGKEVSLTATEFQLLEYLLRHQGRVVSRDMLAHDVWKGRYEPMDNVIDVHIVHLRQKIDGPFGNKLLHTVRGIGYTMRERNA